MIICKLLFCLALGTMLFSGCRKETPATPLPDEAAYVGRLDVIEIDDALFRIDDLRASFVLDAQGRLDISMYDVSFSSKMPVKLSEMILPAVPYTRNGNTLTLSGTDIIPMMVMRGERVPYDRYKCTDLTGTIDPERMVLSMKLGGFQTDYNGSYSAAQ